MDIVRKIWNRDRGMIIAFGLFVIVEILKYIFEAYPWLAESIYHRSFFQFIRNVADLLLGWLPFSSVYLAIIGVLVLVIYILRRRASGRDGWRLFFQNIASLILWLYGLFYILWGFNYYRPPVHTLLGLSMDKHSSQVIEDEMRYMTILLNDMRSSCSKNGDYDMSELNTQVTEVIQAWHFPASGNGAIHAIYPDGALLRFSTSGMYFPHGLQGIYDAGLHPLQVPSTISHELGHVYGYGGESTCNMISVLACWQSDDPFVQYSGTMMYWKYLRSYIRRASPEVYRDIYQSLSSAVIEDLRASQTQMDKYPDIMPKLRNRMYDQYLKSHGIASGIVNYSEVVGLILAWKASRHNRKTYTKIYERDLERE